MRKPTILFVGHGRAGKDEAGEYLALITNLRFAGTTSKYLCRYVAARMGISEEEAYRTRHHASNRDYWYNTGNDIRRDDPGMLLREALQHGEITGGIRDFEEIKVAREQNLVDIIVWIENIWVTVDTTVKFSPRECDLTIPNNWGLQEYHERLYRFAKLLGLLKA